MSILGTSENAQTFLRELDERKLVDLCADLLTIKGHREIKITDGPGDGQRDIHSIDAYGQHQLTQSKYHGDISQSVSAKELGEVVLGMVRLGYKKGLFITNARISPPAKRDCLNSYPDYSIDFIEGWELVKRIFDNLILKAIWYDGKTLDRVSYALVVPAVARNLETDKPLPILSSGQYTIDLNPMDIGRTKVQLRLQKSTVNTSVFGQYRSPRIKTVSEVGSSTITLSEIILSGMIHLEDADELLRKIGEEIVNYLKVTHKIVDHFAVLIGRPSITPLGGEASGSRIELNDYEPFTLVSHNGIIGSELEWILPKEENDWYLPVRPTVSQADWIRWFNPKYNLCLDVTVNSPPSDPVKWMVKEQQQFFIRWWKESLFALLPTTLKDSWASTKLPDPTDWYEWENEKSLGIWLHPNFFSPIVPAMIEPDDKPLEPFFEYDPEQVRPQMEHLKTQLEKLGAISVEPIKARYMIAVVDRDPFPTTEIIEYPGRQLVAEEEQIVPSPIDPNSRGIQFTMCWLIKSLTASHQPSHSDLDKIVEELSEGNYQPFGIEAKYDIHTLSKEIFIIAYIHYQLLLGYEATSVFLQKIEPRNVSRIVRQLP